MTRKCTDGVDGITFAETSICAIIYITYNIYKTVHIYRTVRKLSGAEQWSVRTVAVVHVAVDDQDPLEPLLSSHRNQTHTATSPRYTHAHLTDVINMTPSKRPTYSLLNPLSPIPNLLSDVLCRVPAWRRLQ